MVLPLTSKLKGIPLHVRVKAGDEGLAKESHVMVEMVRSIAIERLAKRLGTVTDATLMEVENRVRILLDL